MMTILTNSLENPLDDDMEQHSRVLRLINQTKKDHCVGFMILSSMPNDLISQFHFYTTTKDIWDVHNPLLWVALRLGYLNYRSISIPIRWI